MHGLVTSLWHSIGYPTGAALGLCTALFRLFELPGERKGVITIFVNCPLRSLLPCAYISSNPLNPLLMGSIGKTISVNMLDLPSAAPIARPIIRLCTRLLSQVRSKGHWTAYWITLFKRFNSQINNLMRDLLIPCTDYWTTWWITFYPYRTLDVNTK